VNTERFGRLVALLKELFQLDKPELDFGFYRIMHARSAEITRFLAEDLSTHVQAALAEHGTAERGQVQRELQEAITQAKALGVRPSSAEKVRTLRARLSEADDIESAEAEVYDHLYRFFRRYYRDGDFISQRLYKDGAYAIPYQGEDVKLHWANADQYYIKTDEHLRNYSFRLRPHVAGGEDPMRVHFRLVDAAEGEHHNVKAANSNPRVFVLADDSAAHAVEEASDAAHRELLIRFEYRPATLEDWPESQRAGKSKPPRQEPLLDVAERRILGCLQAPPSGWAAELEKPHELADGRTADYTRLRAHLSRYTARNTFDYFIHKDLGGFLLRELDFYIKNEVMRLDDIEYADAPRVEHYLSRIRAMRRVASKLIGFLASLEDFQKRLWLKTKFVVETSYCVRLGSVPDDFLPEVAANEAQRREWAELCGIDEIQTELEAPAYGRPLSLRFLRSRPSLVVDTRHFGEDFTARLLQNWTPDSVEPAAILVHGENFQSLSVLSRRCRGQVQCVYIDPPYNAPTSEILYKNNYKHSSFLSMIESRLLLSRDLAAADGSHVVAIDKNERNGVFRLLLEIFSAQDNVAVTVEHNRKGVQDQRFSFTHEYALFSIPPGRRLLNRTERERADWEYSSFRNWGGESLREDGANCFYAVHVRDDRVVGFGEVWTDHREHPEGANVVRDDGIVQVFPIDGSGVERKWRYERGTVEGVRDRLRVRRKGGLFDIEIAKTDDQPKTVWYSPRYNAGDHGTRLLGAMGMSGQFDYPKSVHTVRDCLHCVTDQGGLVLDYFAGSGTTGHAVIDLNREDGGDRRFILVEMGEHFDTVLLPRLKKVIYSPEWKNGRPKRQATCEEAERSPDLIKLIRLESYEDTLNNLRVPEADLESGSDRGAGVVGGAGGDDSSRARREGRPLRYTLDIETRGSASLLDVDRFIDPTAYFLDVKRPGSDESRPTRVDLVETFNWLLGFRVSRLWAPREYDADFERDEEGRLRLRSGLREQTDGRWWFRAVEGTLPDDRRALVVWRKRPGGDDPVGVEQDNLVLSEWFRTQGYADRVPDGDSAFDAVYVNGDHNLEGLRPSGTVWTGHLIEDHFHRLMFESEDSN